MKKFIKKLRWLLLPLLNIHGGGNTPCPFKNNHEDAKTNCPKYDINRRQGICLHLRFEEYCTWVDLKGDEKKEKKIN